MTVTQVVNLVLRDRDYYGEQGGVTFSGGEPYGRHRFLHACLFACKAKGIRTCVQSTLDTDLDILIETLPDIDLFICDIKVMDKDKHLAFTGRSNTRILENMVALARQEMPMVIRIPVVPGHNCDIENITETAHFIRNNLGNAIRQVQLLRYRRLGMEKYESLGIPYPMADHPVPERSQAEQWIKQLAQIMNDLGIAAVAGTTTPF